MAQAAPIANVMSHTSPIVDVISKTSPLTDYVTEASAAGKRLDPGFISYLASLEQVAETSPEVAKAIVAELADQRQNLKMIASENFCSLAVQFAQGNLLTDKYAEGIPYRRFYAGCDNVDTVESLAAYLACDLFGAQHAYVQPHSGADANLVAYWSILSARVQTPALEKLGVEDASALTDEQWTALRAELGNQRLLGLDYYSGGHLTHGYRANLSARMFDAHTYTVDRETRLIDYEAVRRQAREVKPLILLAGYSAYPRKINFRIFREIADEVGAVFMVDMAHFAGLVAGKVFTGDSDPVAHAHIVTTTTHKTLRGPRGGMVLCTKELAEHVDRGCPMVLGGPLPHAMAGKAVAFQEANTEDFQAYAHRIVDNASTLAEYCVKEGMEVSTGGTDNHLMLVDVTTFGLTGRQAESALREANITLNRNSLPFDVNGAWYTSGLRLGTPALTSLGMGRDEMREIVAIIKQVLGATHAARIAKGKNAGSVSKARYHIDADALENAQTRVADLLGRHPLYPDIDLDYLERAFG